VDVERAPRVRFAEERSSAGGNSMGLPGARGESLSGLLGGQQQLAVSLLLLLALASLQLAASSPVDMRNLNAPQLLSQANFVASSGSNESIQEIVIKAGKEDGLAQQLKESSRFHANVFALQASGAQPTSRYVKLGNTSSVRSNQVSRGFSLPARNQLHLAQAAGASRPMEAQRFNASQLYQQATSDLSKTVIDISGQVQQQLQPQQQQQQQQHRKRAGLLEKICIGTSNRMSGQHNKTDHYQNLAERYRNCTYVIGNLEITWLDKAASGEQVDLSFLESIREITGYLLIAYVEVERIRMPNLQIIRGRDLFKLNSDQKEEFALILIENELETLELPNLREILAGSVGSYNNRNLCHIRTINWDEILNWPMYRSVFVYNGTEPECPACDGSCLGSCWGEGPDMCQRFSKTNCAQQCNQARCFGPSAAECCHSFCAGGCVGPKQTDCLACKNFYDDGECIQECPSMMRYNPSKFLWDANPNGKYAFGATCVKECPEHLLRDNGACVRTCPLNKRSVNGECLPCGGPCPKNCQGVEVVHSGNIDQLINCTVIEGSITILDTSFTGYAELYSNNTIGTGYKPMHPSRLEVFKTLREITGYLNIQAHHPDFKNLSCFRNLHTIGGRQTTDMFYALSIIKTSLTSLSLRSLRKVRSGKITIEENEDLCFADTIDWMQINITRREDITTRNNAESSKCRQLGLHCHEQCAQDGCWGPGPDECLSCNNWKLDDYCVDNCTSTQQLVGYLSFESGGRTCRKCHPECKGGCNGTEARHCWQCKNVKDGPYCVAECPSHKYNNNNNNTCEECDKSCADGCTGPSNRLGEGGCNTCSKAVIDSTDPSLVGHCIRLEEPCPEGFYQEYVGPQSEGPLKSSSGMPVCRKCHHRCKSCTGMGTHVSVCECAKYVAGEQCEDYCPRDYFADEQLKHCVKCSPECNGCFGPTEADCISCRVYRIYYDSYSPMASASQVYNKLHTISGDADSGRQQIKFNCTAQCPSDKPHRISESNMLDPYCSDDAGIDIDNPRIVSLGSTSIFFLLIISAAIMVCVSVYRCQIEKDKTVKLTMHLSGIDDVEPLNPSNLKPNLAPLRSIKETELRKGNVLGSGFGGTVFQGFWFPEGQEHKKPRPVAIKVLRDNGQSNINKEFLDEAYIMASVNHPNLVRLLAVCMTPNNLMLVTQLMPLGCLLEYVKKHKNDIGSKNLLEWCKQIAKGMAYLEENRMVHRDLALRNVLLQTSGRALVSDFGLAKLLEVDQSEYQSGGGRLPIKWLAPECIRERKFTHKSDVWAFGVTVWELLTFGMRPFEEYDTKDVPMAIEKGARLHQPSYMSAEVYKVMYACWFYNPDDRPNFKALAQNFVSFARDPERYLICGSKGIEYSLRKELSRTSDSEDNESSSDSNSATEDEVQPMSTIPDLTPSTHNRINEMFGFELQHHHSASEATNLTTPTLKKLAMFQGDVIDEDVFSKGPHIHKTPHALVTDANNNNFVSNNRTMNLNSDSCWSMHHTMSTNSLGKRMSGCGHTKTQYRN